MDYKSINNTLDIIFKYKMNMLESSIFQDAILLSISENKFVLNRENLRFKLLDKKVTRQAISLAIKKLEQKNVLIIIGKRENRVLHKLNDDILLSYYESYIRERG
ncbi:hypothetical protein [Pseudoalteromonas gelatinilytica]|uniref:Uncharacterized protein n=1 Tax=Pseudoalteromonas gelatinilytica TaxID=1703256 RepID=A0ABQ1TDM1_9GAMM|nr:hypothetical protein [Pseudoalteromonas profundi]GGE91373.1 hypothetical protein GCM10008027_15300 [Pseudoalteromonas profundi]